MKGYVQNTNYVIFDKWIKVSWTSPTLLFKFNITLCPDVEETNVTLLMPFRVNTQIQ